MTERTTDEISALDIAYMGVAMRDPNLVHFEEEVALAAGLPGIIAHGTFALGHLGLVVEDLAAGRAIRDFSARLIAPVRPRDVLRVEASPSVDDRAQVEFRATRSDGLVIASGTARLAVR